MKYIKKFETLYHPVDLSVRIKKYINNPINFPENENIKNIFQDISDWCFINIKNEFDRPHIFHQLLRLNENKDKCYNLQIEIGMNYHKVDFNVKSTDYYKSYRLNLKIFNSKEYLNKIEIALKRLLNNGFFVRREGPFENLFSSTDKVENEYFSIYIIDLNDSVTMQNIIDKAPKIII